ncbi:MAG TPA: SurA N-terminal domain-containing protein [Candidatus Babeliales bacterium]|nr:SurA N-terminal domain-containing protein [Candidatus Babeliales bacterium]
MIITIRNQFKQSTFRYIAFLIVIIIAASMISIPSLMQYHSTGTEWALKVNNEKIPYKVFAQEVAEQNEFLAQIRAQYGQYADLLMHSLHLQTDSKSLACEILIKKALMDQSIAALGIYIHPSFITKSINNAQFARQYLSSVLPAFLFDSAGTLKIETLKIFLQHKGISIRDFESKIENSLAQLQYLQFITSSCYIPTFELKQEFIKQNLSKKFSYLTFSFDSYFIAEKKNAISDENAREFYTKESTHHRRYWDPEKRSGLVWRFDPKSYGITISPEQINEYYNNNKVNNYVHEPVKIQVQQITEKQLSKFPGVSLEMVRDDIIENPSSPWKHSWTLLEPFARGEKKGSFEEEAFALTNNNEISSVIDTKDGKVIIQLVRRIPRVYKPIAEVHNEIKNILIEKQFKKSFSSDLKTLIAKGDTKTLEAFIAQKGTNKEFVDGIIKNDTLLSRELFDSKQDQYGFFIEDGIGYATLLTRIVERNLPDFNSIKEIVINDVHEQRAREEMLQDIKHAKLAALSSSFDVIAKELNVPLRYTDMIDPHDDKKMQELEKKELPSKNMLKLDKVGSITVHNGEKVSFLIKVDAIQEFIQSDFDMAQKAIKRTLTPYSINSHIESFVASLHRNATIETNESILITDKEYSE